MGARGVGIVALVVAGAALWAQLRAKTAHPFENRDLPLEERVSNILSLMTLDEKLACLETKTAVPRLGIPDAGASEGLHGLVQSGGFGGPMIPTTTFPETIGLASSWDPDLIRRVGAVAAYEARYIAQNAKYKQSHLVVWGPNADLARDPRWGRNNESYGEDPYLAGTLAAAYAQGLQGDDARYWKAASLVKHFLANSNETTRGGSSSNFDERLFREYYSVPFRMAFEQGGARSFMASYNAWNKVPMTVHPALRQIAVKEWGADGIISSDATAVEQLTDNHKLFTDPRLALARTIQAGISQILTFVPDLSGRVRGALEAHLLTVTDLDAALRGKFRTVIRLGLLDESHDPYAGIGAGTEPEPWTTNAHKALALEAARESVVLLRNDGGLLPLRKEGITSIAVVGTRATEVLSDIYGGHYPYAVTPLDGIKTKVGPRVAVRYADGRDSDKAVEAAKRSDVAVMVVGNHPICGDKLSAAIFNTDTSTKPCADKSEGREGRDRETIELPQEDLIRKVYAANKKTTVVLVSSFPYALSSTFDKGPAVLHTAHASQEEGNAIADVLFGDVNPAGRLNQTWPMSLAQMPPMSDYDIRDGRTYMYFKGHAKFPFGYGLSYTSFDYSHVAVRPGSVRPDDAVTVTADVRNIGKRAGAEVAQLYVRHSHSAVQRPKLELKGFERVMLAPGEMRTVRFTFSPRQFAWWNEKKHQFEVEKEQVELMVGSSSEDIRGRAALRVQ